MKKQIIFIFLTLSVALHLWAQPKHTLLIRLELSRAQYKALDAMKIKLATGLIDGKALAVVSENEYNLLKERGYKSQKIMRSNNEVELYRRALYGKSMKLDPVYHTCQEIVSEIDSLALQYPDLVQVRQIGVTSQLKQPIMAVKISDNAGTEEDEPAILFSGGIHSDELPGVEICMTLIRYLLTHYSSDARVRHWVDANEIWLIPVINVDGHGVVTQNIDPRWRKNLRDNNQNGILYEEGDGIDLNRNFDFNWAHGGSSDPQSERYRGEYPFSESESRAVRDLALDQKFVLSITYHSQGEVVYYPWLWRGRKAPDDALLTKIARGLASKIKTMSGDSTYVPFYGAGTVGQTYPWLYGVTGDFDFIVETGKNRHIFPADELQTIIRDNLPGAFFMLNQLDGP
ncbi:MAG: zinc carboxypeptidase, partial [Calditrichaeota bacterium]|nr:zinc carboxypeptidase [Calditrichota bacterium]